MRELKALDYLYNSKMFKYGGDETHFREQYDLVRQALQRLEAIENVEPSEALKITNSYLKVFEEEIGCSLEIMIRALKQDRIYQQGVNVYGDYDEKIRLSEEEDVHLSYSWKFECLVLAFGIFSTFPVKLSDYKKTWWLKEDKSE